jgi:hypothetical protein
MADENALTPTPRNETVGAGKKSGALVPLDTWRIAEALESIVQKIGDEVNRRDRPVDVKQWWADVDAGIDPQETGMWEALSHGLAMPLKGDFHTTGREQDKGFYDRLADLAKEKGIGPAYLELETDFLRFDDHGWDRKFSGGDYPKPIELRERLAQNLFMRVTAFSALREQLAREGDALPENPALEEARQAVLAFFKTRKLPGAEGLLEDPRRKTSHPRLGPGDSGTGDLPSR